MCGKPVGEWEGRVRRFNYTEETVETAKSTLRKDALIVSEAWVYEHDKGGGRRCGIYFLLFAQDLKEGVTRAQAIKRANEERERRMKEMLADPQWGKNPIYNWDGSFLERQEQ